MCSVHTLIAAVWDVSGVSDARSTRSTLIVTGAPDTSGPRGSTLPAAPRTWTHNCARSTLFLIIFSENLKYSTSCPRPVCLSLGSAKQIYKTLLTFHANFLLLITYLSLSEINLRANLLLCTWFQLIHYCSSSSNDTLGLLRVK